MSEETEVRLATIDDLSALEEVGDRLFDYSIKRNRAEEFLNDTGHHLTVAYNKGKVIGMASGLHHVHPDKDPALFIDEVGVLEEFLGKGLGRKLVHHLCEYGKELSCNVAWVMTENTNIAARMAYSKAEGVEDKGSFVLMEFT